MGPSSMVLSGHQSQILQEYSLCGLCVPFCCGKADCYAHTGRQGRPPAQLSIRSTSMQQLQACWWAGQAPTAAGCESWQHATPPGTWVCRADPHHGWLCSQCHATTAGMVAGQAGLWAAGCGTQWCATAMGALFSGAGPQCSRL